MERGVISEIPQCSESENEVCLYGIAMGKRYPNVVKVRTGWACMVLQWVKGQNVQKDKMRQKQH